ncbi:hypothetical protein BGX28_008197 [Mortierella sp. GBA30]|nr:hypothetical protein BGX28_008197 [Mortierella sp. GBA30]
MGGRYDPVNDEFDSDNWPFHTMMIVYFFFTAILLLNVLIALINDAFSLGDNTWHLSWLENRLEYVESAENMSYHIPGFRQSNDWFPREIYYSATISQVREYQSKYSNDKDGSEASHRLCGQGVQTQTVNDGAGTNSNTSIFALQQDRERETKDKELQSAINDSLQKELRHSQVQLMTLHDLLKEQQQSFEAQIRDLKLADKAEMKEIKDLLSAVLSSTT